MAVLDTMINVGASYHSKDRLEEDELEHLAMKANERLSTINGDTGTIEITVRQFALLVHAWANLDEVHQ